MGYFNLARLESLKVDFRARIGSVLSRQHTPISIGRNHPNKTHPLIQKYSKYKTIHAEMDSIIGLDRHLASGSTMYVYRENKNGELANSSPCAMCLSFMKEMGIKKVYHTYENGYKEIKL